MARIIRISAAVLAVVASVAVAGAAEPVVVDYGGGIAELANLEVGAKPFNNRDYVVKDLPSELNGLQFVRHSSLADAPISFDAPAGTTVYVLAGRISAGEPLRQRLTKDGWKLLNEPVTFSETKGRDIKVSVYRFTFSKAAHFDAEAVHSNGGGIVVSQTLVLKGVEKPPAAEPADEPSAPPDVPSTEPSAGATTRVATRQATIHALEIYKVDNGMMLGQASEATLTVTPGDTTQGVTLSFATKVGHEMLLARDDMVRYVRLKYPNWDVKKAELTFEDKYVGHDGGSIGAALGTLVLSTIEGWAIAPDLAMTGDISANGKVRAIGGVAAKLKGAIAAKCGVTAVPTDNYDQLVDAVVYNGPALLLDTQVIGIATLDDATDVARVDRPQRLAKAIEKFDSLRQTATTRPSYYKTKAGEEELGEIAELAPQHYSAKILLAMAQGKLPRTLSATATQYYATLAAGPVLGLFKSREGDRSGVTIASGAVKAGVADLEKLQAIANPGTRALVENWIRFIEAVDARQSRGGSQAAVERARQTLLDEMSREQSDPDMMQKMLNEGM